MSHTFTTKINCGNAASTDEAGNSTPDTAAPEPAHILRHIADRLEAGSEKELAQDVRHIADRLEAGSGKELALALAMELALELAIEKPGRYTLKEV